MSGAANYDPRYLAGIVLFNRRDFFEAHEVWEDLWADADGAQRRFYQGLIQAAVGLCHFANGNLRGAAKLYRSARDYMERCGSPFLGLDTTAFWEQMARCFADVLADPDCRGLELAEGLIPQIVLNPAPPEWPDPADFRHEEE
jgi:predicted metal-dependent hydrolase